MSKVHLQSHCQMSQLTPPITRRRCWRRKEVQESQGPRVPRSRGPKNQDISNSHSNTSLTLKKVHIVLLSSFIGYAPSNVMKHIWNLKLQVVSAKVADHFYIHSSGFWNHFSSFKRCCFQRCCILCSNLCVTLKDSILLSNNIWFYILWYVIIWCLLYW